MGSGSSQGQEKEGKRGKDEEDMGDGEGGGKDLASAAAESLNLKPIPPHRLVIYQYVPSLFLVHMYRVCVYFLAGKVFPGRSLLMFPLSISIKRETLVLSSASSSVV